MLIQINIDEAKITALVEEKIAESIYQQYSDLFCDAKWGLRSGVEKATKEYIYTNKDKIIEDCVKRSTNELVRKALPKLLESMQHE